MAGRRENTRFGREQGNHLASGNQAVGAAHPALNLRPCGTDCVHRASINPLIAPATPDTPDPLSYRNSGHFGLRSGTKADSRRRNKSPERLSDQEPENPSPGICEWAHF